MLLKVLTDARGVAGREEKIRGLIKDELERYVDSLSTDPMGNLYAWKNKGKGPLIMIAAHMDEVGFMVMGFDKSGVLHFAPIGGVDLRVVVGKRVKVGMDGITGVIGAKPIHMQKENEKEKPFDQKELFIDIGAASDEEAKKLVEIGDQVTFATVTENISEHVIKGKAFDDRAGCSALVEILKADLPVSICGAFTVQEEVGLRGAGVAAHKVQPQFALTLEGTTASDVPESKEHLYSTSMGRGPALTVMDRSFMGNPNLNRHLVSIAEKADIPYQMRRSNTGGTDSGRIHIAKTGIPTAGISLPCRYIHGPASLLDLNDYNNMVAWIKAILTNIAEGGNFFAETY